MGVKSSLSIAGGVSSNLSNAANQLNSITASTSTASRTNVAGNEKAKSTSITLGKDVKTLAESIVSAGKNIHSVAKDFSEIDLKAAQQFQANTSLMSRWMK